MDDLLIVRYSERSRAHRGRRSAPVPLNASLSMVLGTALGFAIGIQFIAKNPDAPVLGLLLGFTIGISSGFLLNRLSSFRRRPRKGRYYKGMPIQTDRGET